MTRREWLLVLASVAAAPASLAGTALQSPDGQLRAWIDTHVSRDALADLARAYLARNPGEGVAMMTAALLEDRRPGVALDAHVASLVRRDFEANRVEDVDGWVLTRTEARLIALAFA